MHMLFQNKKKNNIMNELRSLQERINNDGADTSVQKLRYLLQLLKVHFFFIFDIWCIFMNL